MEALIQDLAAIKSRPDLFNPYAPDRRANEVRRGNLRRYWREMARRKPRVAFVGEAVGYRGGRMTGIPFVSERILRQPPRGCPFHEADYPLARQDNQSWAEATATIVWETIGDLGVLPLFWNALPFHPHRAGDLLTNRAPRVAELELGRPFLHRVLDLFDIELVVAIGNKAERTLTDLGVAHVKVRHPSHGGKWEFRQGVASLADRGWFAAPT
jgi:hypothetical protein